MTNALNRHAPVDISYPLLGENRRTVRFAKTFRIGRNPDCEVRLVDQQVSRHHVEVYWDGDRWWVRDLGSSNGTYLAGRLIHRFPLTGKTTLELGSDGPRIQLEVVPLPTSEISLNHPSVQPQPVSAAAQINLNKQAWRYRIIIGICLILLISGTVINLHHYLKVRKANQLAIDIFYQIKTMELQIAYLEEKLSKTDPEEYIAEMAAKKQEIDKLRQQYQEFVNTLGIIEARTSNEVDRLILNIAQLFGECEVNMPQAFVDEVKLYITKWKSTRKLEKAIQRLRERGYAPVIYRELTAHHLPPQFLYVALQESGFDERAVGTPTRVGYAKGMWQFIPRTAEDYGLRLGPFQDSDKYDPADDRHDPVKASIAAAKYLKYLYTTDAQASGLLVMASYNWGEGRVRRLIRQMPENPKERNFWRLMTNYRIPKETRDYVFYIFSATVIGENPRLFGFQFDNPLHGLAESLPSR